MSAKQRFGAARQFVSVPQTCQWWPGFALVAGTVLGDLTATQ